MSDPTYNELTDASPLVSKVVSRNMLNAISETNRGTTGLFIEKWKKNVRANMDLYHKHGSVGQNLLGIGADKAVIFVGAGPSFHKNKHVLKDVFERNIGWEINDQPFMIICCNHQFKSLVKFGVQPHFVMLLDATARVNEQLNHQYGDDTILIASLFSSPKVLKEWDKRGRHIAFFLPDDEQLKEIVREQSDEDLEYLMLPNCGNVTNTAWVMSRSMLHSKVFMTVGNELSFNFDVDQKKRNFYADGKVESDKERQQVKENITWQSFKLGWSDILQKPTFDFEQVATSKQMFVYKTWLELHVASWCEEDFHFFNCSEEGILGVLSKSDDPQKMYEKDNWYLLDELTTKYHTMRLCDAVGMYMEAKCLTLKETENNARSVVVYPARTDIAKITGQHQRSAALPG